jgi:hypothetical protein
MSYNVVNDEIAYGKRETILLNSNTVVGKQEREGVRCEVSKAMAFSMELFDFQKIIDCCDDLSDAEKAWAKKHLDWKVVVLPPIGNGA